MKYIALLCVIFAGCAPELSDELTKISDSHRYAVFTPNTEFIEVLTINIEGNDLILLLADNTEIPIYSQNIKAVSRFIIGFDSPALEIKFTSEESLPITISSESELGRDRLYVLIRRFSRQKVPHD